jgi:hypothetical protein
MPLQRFGEGRRLSEASAPCGVQLSFEMLSWVDENKTSLEYSALLTRVCREYERRFP